MAKEKFAENYIMEFNPSKSYMLCFKKENKHKDQAPAPLTYFIYDINNDSVLFEESIGAGRVKWLNDYQVEISLIPGIVKGDEKQEDTNLNYIYDLRLQKKLFTTNDKGK
ncbi:MAG: hypothetical protein A2068_01000 [Ignavibacteria bacterium GWB2_35_6b]|nr:MAG: hypothetical protein A2068_01000 [Ignavibacteria bacterium GWB2_35_6b]